MAFSSHFWHGTCAVAFVFSVPGEIEKTSGRPISGSTGENLSMALEHLNSAMPDVFISTDRYAYRITNAYDQPIAKALGHIYTEATDAQVLQTENVARVIAEIDGCETVVLCGRKAQLLNEFITTPGRKVARVWHTSNQALCRKYNTTSVKQINNPRLRREERIKLWAKELLIKVEENDVGRLFARS